MSNSPNDDMSKEQLEVNVKYKFKADEKVYCFHLDHIYEARTQGVKYVDGKIQYNIHYVGWNKKWDEWVEEERILEYNEENMKKCLEMKPPTKERSRLSKGAKGIRPGKTPTATSTGSGKRARDSDGENLEETPQSTRKRKGKSEQAPSLIQESIHEINLDMTKQLRFILAQDNYQVEVEKKLIKVPSMTTVKQVLEDYERERLALDIYSLPVIRNFPFSSLNFLSQRSSEDRKEITLESMTTVYYKGCFRNTSKAICLYFDSFFEHLLYTCEIPQFNKVMKTGENNSNDVEFQPESKPVEQTRSTESRGRGRPSNSSDGSSSRALSRKAPTKEIKKASDIYPPVYLLRFFSEFGKIFANNDVDNDTLTMMKHFFNDFICFLNEHRVKYFSDILYEASSESLLGSKTGTK